MKQEFQFEIGDRIRCVSFDPSHQTRSDHIGLTGTIFKTGYLVGKTVYGVQHDECRPFLHGNGGQGPANKCWNYYAHEIELIPMTVCAVDDLL